MAVIDELLATFSLTEGSNTPAGTDLVGAELDDHLRVIKRAIAQTGQWDTLTVTAATALTATADMSRVFLVDTSASASIILTLPAAPIPGWNAIVRNTGAGETVLSGTIDGASNLTLSGSAQAAFIWYGDGYHAIQSNVPAAVDPHPIQTNLTTAGSGTAYTVTTGESYASLSAVPTLILQAHAASGATPTLNVDSLGAKSLKKFNATDLEATDLALNQRFQVVYNDEDDTWEVLSAIKAPSGGASDFPTRGGLAPHKELKIERSLEPTETDHIVVVYAGDSLSGIDGHVWLEDSSNNWYKWTGESVTADLETSGAGGLDTGSESSATFTWYYVWVIHNPTTDTTSGLLSLDPDSPTMPSGYTYKGLVGAVANLTDNNLMESYQVDDVCSARNASYILSHSAPPSNGMTSIDMSEGFPKKVKRAHVNLLVQNLTQLGSSFVLAPKASNSQVDVIASATQNTNNYVYMGNICSVQEDQTLYYRSTQTAGTTNLLLYITGWTFK